VGEDGAAPYKPWVLRWNGKAWKSVPMPKLPLTKTVGVGLPAADLTAVLSGNATALFGISPSTTGR
jgi:hypothetical protein